MEAASGGDGAGLPKPTAATCNAITGLATGRFGARLKNGVVTSQGIVHGKSDLSAADKAALARLPADGRYFTMNLEFPPRGLPADGGPRPRRRRAHHGLPLAEMDLTLHRVELAELIAFLAVLLLAGFAGTGFVRRSLRPLRQVAATATRVTELPLASGSVTLTERVPNANPRTGVCQSNAAFNRLLQHVEAGLPGVLRARHGCAGSPRTRVTSCAPRCQPSRGYAELGRRHPGPRSRRNQARSEPGGVGVARMSLLVDELLLLAQLDQLPGRWPGSWSISPGWPSTPPATRRWPRKITAGCLSCPMSRSWYLVTGTGCTRCRST